MVDINSNGQSINNVLEIPTQLMVKTHFAIILPIAAVACVTRYFAIRSIRLTYPHYPDFIEASMLTIPDSVRMLHATGISGIIIVTLVLLLLVYYVHKKRHTWSFRLSVGIIYANAILLLIIIAIDAYIAVSISDFLYYAVR